MAASQMAYASGVSSTSNGMMFIPRVLTSSASDPIGHEEVIEEGSCCSSGFVSDTDQEVTSLILPSKNNSNKVSFTKRDVPVRTEGSTTADDTIILCNEKPYQDEDEVPDIFYSPQQPRRNPPADAGPSSLPSSSLPSSPQSRRFSFSRASFSSRSSSNGRTGRTQEPASPSSPSKLSSNFRHSQDTSATNSTRSVKKPKLATRRPTMISVTASACQQLGQQFVRRASTHGGEPAGAPDPAPSRPRPRLGSTIGNGVSGYLSLSKERRDRRGSLDLLRAAGASSSSSSSFSHIQMVEVAFKLPTGDVVKLECPGNKTVGQIKEMLWDTIRDTGLIEFNLALADSEEYTLKYRKFGTDYELFDQEQLFQTLSIVSYWRSKGTAQPEIRVEVKKAENEEARQFQLFLNSLIGVDMLLLVENSNNDEADITRRKLISARHVAVSSRDSDLYAMEPELTHSEVPDSIKKVSAKWIEIHVQFEDKSSMSQEILFQVTETPLNLLQFLFGTENGKRELLGIPDDADACMYALKVCGKESYLYSGNCFLSYTYIRRCLLKKEHILLAVVKKPDTAEDAVKNYGEPDFIDDCSNLTGSHHQLSSLTKEHSQVFTMSLWDIETPFRLKVVGLDRVPLGDTSSWTSLYLEIGLYHGGQLLCPAKGTTAILLGDESIVINQQFYFDIAVCDVPKAARMHIVVYGMQSMKKPLASRRGSSPNPSSSPNVLSPPSPGMPQPSSSPQSRRRWWSLRALTSPRLLHWRQGDQLEEHSLEGDSWDSADAQDSVERPDAMEPFIWVNVQLLDHRAILRTGSLQLSMWHIPIVNGERDTSKFSPNGCTSENPNTRRAASLLLELDEYAHRVACPTSGLGMLRQPSDIDLGSLASTESTDEVRGPNNKVLRGSLDDAISSSDPLRPLTKMEKDLLWNCRDLCRKRPEALPRLLQALNWADKNHVLEMHRLLATWHPLTIEVSLQLLDFHFADEEVRRLAVKRLEELENDDLLTFLLQLVQTLKFESYHDSSLAYFLLERALKSKRIGHNFFWFLRAEMDTPEYRERFGLLLEAYLRGCGQYMLDIIDRQQRVNQFLKMTSSLMKEEKMELRAATLQKLLATSDVMKGNLRPVYDSSLLIGDLVVKQCKVMDSKKAPFWLEFVNKDPTDVSHQPVKVIFKQGDDLRQDMLTLQMIKLMDKLWQDNGLDLNMVPYGCMSTGHEVGMIQVVLDAETVASIQRKRGGDILSNARASFTDETLANWLKEKQASHSDHVQAVRRFVLSCAGYCVATYVLGIGDRHNDNIMITKSGNLFHIDFGHFLGNTKKFLFVNRERVPFVLTPDFVHIMGKKDSSNFQDFVSIACRAYNIIRSHAHLFINLFSMMKRTGIPELTCIEDIDYLRNVLLLNKTDEEASAHFQKQVERCLELAWTVRCNFVVHNVKRR